jgi:hypothetical protein
MATIIHDFDAKVLNISESARNRGIKYSPTSMLRLANMGDKARQFFTIMFYSLLFLSSFWNSDLRCKYTKKKRKHQEKVI